MPKPRRGHARGQAADDPAEDRAAADEPERPLGLAGGQHVVGQRPHLRRGEHAEHAHPDVDGDEQGAADSAGRLSHQNTRQLAAKNSRLPICSVAEVGPPAGPDVERRRPRPPGRRWRCRRRAGRWPGTGRGTGRRGSPCWPPCPPWSGTGRRRAAARVAARRALRSEHPLRRAFSMRSYRSAAADLAVHKIHPVPWPTPPHGSSALTRLLAPVAELRPGEAATALLMFAYSFLAMTATTSSSRSRGRSSSPAWAPTTCRGSSSAPACSSACIMQGYTQAIAARAAALDDPGHAGRDGRPAGRLLGALHAGRHAEWVVGRRSTSSA